MMRTNLVFATLGAALAFTATQAHAVSFQGATGPAVNHVTDYSTDGLLSFDVDLATLSSVTLNFRIEAEDLASPQVQFNSLVRNLSGLGLPTATVLLGGGVSFGAPVGSVTTDGFATAAVQSHATSIEATFSPALTTEFYIGNPLAVAGASDWTLNLAGHQVGDAFTVTVAVPEPESVAMALAGVLIAGSLALRRSSRVRRQA